jgi:hypothetical protein
LPTPTTDANVRIVAALPRTETTTRALRFFIINLQDQGSDGLATE